MSTVEFISGKVTDTAACNFLETNSTAIVCQNFHIYFKQSKWNKLPLPLGRSQENVHDGVHFWNSYRYCCSQLFKKELHFSQLEGLLQKLWNKINKKVVSAFSTFQRKCLYKEVHFRRSYWVLPPTFWKKNSTVVISKVFPKSFETKQIKKLSPPSELFQKNVDDEVYFWKNYKLLPPTLTQINSIVAISREFSKSFETIKNVSSLWNVSDGIISRKITGCCSLFSLKKKEFCCCRFRSSHRTCSMKKGVLRNFAQFTGKHLCQSIFFNKVAGRRLQIYLKRDSGTGVFLWIAWNF